MKNWDFGRETNWHYPSVLPSIDSDDCGHEEDIVGDGESNEQTVERFSELPSGQNSDRQCVP